MPRKPGNYGDSNRDGIDDSLDHAPGNDGQSPEYARRYDYGSTTEYSVYGVDRTDQIQSAIITRENQRIAARAHEADLAAQNKVHYWPNVGKFIIPDENTWAAHAEIVKDDKSGLTFNPGKYVYFDKIIAEHADIPALYDKNNPEYARYEGLRTNLEVLRNDIMGIYMNDGSFDPGDEVYIPQLESIAAAIGDSLSRDKWYNRLLGHKSVNVDIANIEGVGAAALYEHLLTLQKNPAPLQALRDQLNTAVGLPQDNIWQLPPLEETPYSPEGLSAPPPKSQHCLSMEDIEEFKQEQLAQQQQLNDPSAQIAAIADRAMTAVPKLSVEELEEATKSESVEEARKILRNLRNMEFGDHNIEEWLDTGTPAAQAAKADALGKLVDIYQLQTQLAEHNPAYAKDMFTEDGDTATDAMRLAIVEFAIRNLPKDHPKLSELEQFVFNAPEHAHVRQIQSIDRLLDHISTGLERATGKQVYDRTPAERLVSMSNRIQKSARRMRSIETMDPPARMESIALAHEILRRLKDMEMSRQPLDQFIDTGRPEDKAAVAQKIDEVVDMYKNIVSEAVHINPELMKDARVQEGVDAAGEFAHAVKLMAAQEMPNSIAAAQHIGADATQKPEEWDKLHDRTVERIVTSMEGGLEEAVGTIEVQEQAEEQAEEQQREASLEQMMHQHGHIRKKRKRWTRSGYGGKLQEKLLQDIRADDRVLKQGIYQDNDLDLDRPRAAASRYEAPSRENTQQEGNEKSGVNKQQQLNIKHMMDDRIQSQGRFRSQEMASQEAERRATSMASKNTRSGRSGARRANEMDQQRMEADARRDMARAQRQQERTAQADTPNAMQGAMPKGLSPNALASLQNVLKQEGSTLLNMNKQAGSLPPTDKGSSPARFGESNIDREQQRNNTNRPRGNERA
jgi:hypothetical protein